MQRTQIYLPEDLRREIDKQRSPKESLSDYIRKAAEEKVEKEKRKKVAIQDVIEALDALDPRESGWKDVDPVEWQRQIRQESEERLEREWNTGKKK